MHMFNNRIVVSEDVEYREQSSLVQVEVGRTRNAGVRGGQQEHVTRETHAWLKSRDFIPTETKNGLRGLT